MSKFWNGLLQGGSLVISGAGIGWLMGLSASPVVATVLASIFTLVVAIVSALSGVEIKESSEKKEKAEEATPKEEVSVGAKSLQAVRSMNALPLACCMIGIFIGTYFGTKVRTNEVLGVEPKSFVRKWEEVGLKKEEIAKRLFDHIYSKQEAEDKKEDKNKEEPNGGGNTHSGVLFSNISEEQCVEWKNLPDSDLRRLMLTSKDEQIRKFVEKCTDAKSLRAAVENLLCSGKQSK